VSIALLESFYNSGKPIALVCHSPGVLRHVKYKGEQLPHSVKLMRHRHPEDRIYTVISGVFYIGLGDEFDSDKLEAYPPGTVIVLPGNRSHLHWAKSGDYVTQVSAIGLLGMEYVNSKDDPRNQHSSV
jgi:hypothetical protein